MMGMSRRRRRQQVPPSTDGSLDSRWRIAISILLLVHLAAVVTGPFAFATRSVAGTSPLADLLMASLRWYIDAAYLNHGYAFFAPDPGPSHLLRCRLEFDDGRPPLELTIPDRNSQWPRLLYHRHFMLSEKLHLFAAPPELPPDVPVESLPAWTDRLRMYQRLKGSYADHLRARYGAARVQLRRVEHRLPPPQPRPGGVRLDDPALYVELPEPPSAGRGAGGAAR